jgi:hypothetical protein
MFTGMNGLTHEIFLLLFEGHLWEILWDSLCNCSYPKAALAFQAGIFMVGLGR